MKKLMILILLSFTVIGFANNNAGTDGAAFLKIDVGAKPSALGGAYTGYAEDVYALYYNVAGLNNIEQTSITAQHNNWLDGIKEEFVAIGYRFDNKNVFGLSVTMINIGDIVKTTENISGSYTGTSGTYTADDFSMNLGYSYKLNPAASVGISAKYIKQTISGYKADAYAMDIGFITDYIDEDIKFGFSISNLGSKLKFINEEDKLPIIYRFGMSYKMVDWLFLCDLVKPDDNDLAVKTGIEYTFLKKLFLRAGYNSKDDLSDGFSFGLGFKYQRFDIDYAFLAKDTFNNVHKFSLNYSF